MGKRFSGVGSGTNFLTDIAVAIVADDLANIYVTGACSANETYSDYVTIKYLPVCDCTPPLQGDIVSDCFVGFDDLAILAFHWLDGSEQHYPLERR